MPSPSSGESWAPAPTSWLSDWGEPTITDIDGVPVDLTDPNPSAEQSEVVARHSRADDEPAPPPTEPPEDEPEPPDEFEQALADVENGEGDA